MRTKKIVVSNKECNVSIRAFPAAITVGYLIGELERSVKTLDNLFEPAIFGGDRIVISKSDNLNQVEIHVL